jgi:DNA-binding IclR family transcriptional regulator
MEQGFLVRIAEADRVVLGPHLIRLVRHADVGRVLVDVARESLHALDDSLRETVTLSVVASDGDLDLDYQVDAPRQIRPRDWVGQRFPLHASSSASGCSPRDG